MCQIYVLLFKAILYARLPCFVCTILYRDFRIGLLNWFKNLWSTQGNGMKVYTTIRRKAILLDIKVTDLKALNITVLLRLIPFQYFKVLIRSFLSCLEVARWHHSLNDFPFRKNNKSAFLHYELTGVSKTLSTVLLISAVASTYTLANLRYKIKHNYNHN